ncbi:cell division protein FtsA [Carboxydothermus ferrireducens]|uniref:Cell division protein FtsA n=1 Tax=Carboxydothermus ferrireducens DSM 11255 TaxID=1119529 RepID=A0ABX2RB52_9THEO|nr:cell division FtsA domain-containing protein [Carboxydothermus ferrireducens]NYE57832.1 cell division protein FtsA [Carboxydothermus ferrireducens DSM 11255]
MDEKNIIFALDIGTRTVIGVVAEVLEDGKIKILKETLREHNERSMLDGQIHDIAKVAGVVTEIKEELEKELGIKLTKAAIAAAGRALYTATAYAEKEIAGGEVSARQVFELESQALEAATEALGNQGDVRYELVGYSIINYYLDGYPFKALEGHRGKKMSVELVATFLPETVTASLQAVLIRSGLEPLSLTLEPIAAIAATVPESLRLLNIALVDIGAGTSDIAIARDGAAVAYGMVPEAGDEVTEEIMRQFLVDFPDAENIKKQLALNKEITFYDILGQEVKLPAEEIISRIEPTVERIAGKVAEEIRRLNGGTPKAVFLVGGGAKTPGIAKKLSELLGLDVSRVAVKGCDLREQKFLTIPERLKGPEGVTVLGILLTALKKYDHGFITVFLNGREVRLLHRQNLNVGEVLKLSGITPAEIFGQEGKSLMFYLNGKRREVKGELPRVCEIYVNGQTASLKTAVGAGDSIKFVPARDGGDAKLTVKDLLNEYRSIVIKVNGEEIALNPLVTLNNEVLADDYLIKEGDNLIICSRETVGTLFAQTGKILVNGREVDLEYRFFPGDEVVLGEEAFFPNNDSLAIKITLNGRTVKLDGKSSYILADVLPYLEEIPPKVSSLKILLNDREAGFTDELKDGDVIQILL